MRWLLLLGFGAIGLAALGGGVTWGVDDFLHASATSGIVVELREEQPDPMTVRFYPVVEYSDSSGELLRFRSPAWSADTPEYEQGAKVNVLYDPLHPAKARIGSFWHLWSGPAAVAFLGAVVLILAFSLFRKMGSFEKDLSSYGSDTRRRS